MKRNTKFMAAKSILLVLCLGLFSFSSKRGGDSFQIWLNGKMLLQQFVLVSKGVETIQLTSSSESDRLEIVYNHCGQTGTSRYITIKDENDKPLKVWEFADANGKNAGMSIKVKDIISLKRKKDSKVNVFYSSRELPQGRELASLALTGETSVASR